MKSLTQYINESFKEGKEWVKWLSDKNNVKTIAKDSKVSPKIVQIAFDWMQEIINGPDAEDKDQFIDFLLYDAADNFPEWLEDEHGQAITGDQAAEMFNMIAAQLDPDQE